VASSGSFLAPGVLSLLALTELSLPPDKVLFVAGSAHDVGGALAVGMPVVWVNRLNLPTPPEAASALIVDNLSTLAGMIE
jgi:FMN phosphatase YigB (HAD superfamily)